MIKIYEPFLNKKTLSYAHDAIDSSWISSQGYYLDATKEKLKDLLGVKWLVLTNNGTTASHLLSKSIQYKNPNIKNIICPNNVYVAAWNSFLYDNFYKLKPIDSDINTWNFDLNLIDPNEDDALLVVHNLGNIINVPELQKKFENTIIVEDNCEGLLGKYDNFYSGTKSLCSSSSFFGNKTLTSGEGGCFITNDEEVFEYINNIRNQGQSSEKFIHNNLGYNYRMTNIQAALLYGQLEIVDEILERKSFIFDLYKKNLSSIDGVSFQEIDKSTQHSNWMFSVRFNHIDLQQKKSLELFLYQMGVETRPMFYSINTHNHLRHVESVNTISDLLNSQILVLPSHPNLNKGQILYICNLIKDFFKLKK
jgi:perosamine synthetase